MQKSWVVLFELYKNYFLTGLFFVFIDVIDKIILIMIKIMIDYDCP